MSSSMIRAARVSAISAYLKSFRIKRVAQIIDYNVSTTRNFTTQRSSTTSLSAEIPSLW